MITYQLPTSTLPVMKSFKVISGLGIYSQLTIICINHLRLKIAEVTLTHYSTTTDYIGRVVSNKLSDTKTNITLRKIRITDISGNPIVITLWPDKINLIDDTTVAGDILAITTTRVTEYDGFKQLESTYLTTVTVNPTTPNTKLYIDRLKDLPTAAPQDEDGIPITIHELLNTTSVDNMNERKTYSCMATIKEIFSYRNWYYEQCSMCRKPLHPEDNDTSKFACRNHDNITPKFQYCLNASIMDNTGITDVVIFNETVAETLNIECRQMVVDKGYVDQKILPPEISAMVGVLKKFKLSVRHNRLITIDKIDDTSDIHHQHPHPHDNTATIATTPLQPTTPNPKAKRPMQEEPGTAEKKQRM
ncbi:uncharacterized protein LOC143530933 isoform X2 [Bidens hawaiensis]|uniref:uncharacterized protein LOC143530933 isoform X2 n=1 Tax=Bidens hawaiensis TaxID=980011 RepID=UPI004049CCD1